jgi:hypothetical protein
MAFFPPPADEPISFGQSVRPFDLSRQQLLETPLQTPLVEIRLQKGSTLSPWRLRPNVIHHWDDFAALVIEYHAQTVTQADKQALVCFMTDVFQIYTFVRNEVVNSESTVKSVIDREPEQFHYWLTTTAGGQPKTSDVHSAMQKHDPELPTSGWSDYIFIAADGTRLTIMMECKIPWKVTPTSINQVLNGNTEIILFSTNYRNCP